MVLKIDYLKYALERYTNVVGAIEDKSDRENTNKRQAFINAFKDVAGIHILTELFDLADANNVRYALKIHDTKMYRYKDYAYNFDIASKILFTTIANVIHNNEKTDSKMAQEA